MMTQQMNCALVLSMTQLSILMELGFPNILQMKDSSFGLNQHVMLAKSVCISEAKLDLKEVDCQSTIHQVRISVSKVGHVSHKWIQF